MAYSVSCINACRTTALRLNTKIIQLETTLLHKTVFSPTKLHSLSPLSVIGINFLPVFLYPQSQHHCSCLTDLQSQQWAKWAQLQVNIYITMHSFSFMHTQYLRIPGSTDDRTQGRDNGRVFESLFELDCGLNNTCTLECSVIQFNSQVFILKSFKLQQFTNR